MPFVAGDDVSQCPGADRFSVSRPRGGSTLLRPTLATMPALRRAPDEILNQTCQCTRGSSRPSRSRPARNPAEVLYLREQHASNR